MIEKIQKFIGLASADEVREKFDGELAQIILDERQIVFWRFGFLWAMFGAGIMFLLMLFAQIMRYLYG